MNDERPDIDRRRLLAALAGTAATGLAGCLGSDAQPATGDGADATTTSGASGDGSDDGGDPKEDAGDGDETVDCAALGGPTTTFDREEYPLPFLFDYPESFEEYNRESANARSVRGAMLGHAATERPGHYQYVLTVMTGGAMDAESTERWLSMPGVEPDGTVEYGGREAERTIRTSGKNAIQWKVALPTGDDTFYGVTILVKGDSDRPCIDALEAIARDAMDSFRPA